MKSKRLVWAFFCGVALVALGGPLIALNGCQQTPNPPDVDYPPLPMPDGWYDAKAGDAGYTCNSYCANATALKCPFSKPTHHDAGCVEVCTNFQTSGIASWNLSCRTRATSCAAIDACEK